VATWADVRRIAQRFPDLVEKSARDWRVRDKMVVWERPLRKADTEFLGDSAPTGAILGARVADVGVKEALVADAPDIYFTTPHFDGYAAVLVRLAEISSVELAELIEEAWLDRAPKTLVKRFLAEQ
jgi:hypothetical protein